MLNSKTCASLALILALGATPAFAQTDQQRQQHPPGTAAAPATGTPQQGGAAGTASGSPGMPMMGRMGQGMMGQGMMGQGMMGQGMMGAGMGRMDMMSAMAGRVEGRIAFLKAELGITDAQLPLWNAVADAMRANAKTMGTMAGEMMGMMSQPAPLPDKLAAREKAMVSGLDALRKLKAAIGPLYASLSDDQKKTADELMAGQMGGGMMAGGRMGMSGGAMMGGGGPMGGGKK